MLSLTHTHTVAHFLSLSLSAELNTNKQSALLSLSLSHIHSLLSFCSLDLVAILGTQVKQLGERDKEERQCRLEGKTEGNKGIKGAGQERTGDKRLLVSVCVCPDKVFTIWLLPS